MADWKKFVFGELTWKRLFKSVLSIYLILMVVAVALGNYFIFVPPQPSYTMNAPNISFIKSGEDSIAALYLPASNNMPTLLWSHGNAEDLGYARPLLETFHAAGFGVLAYDYPSYGLSTGEASDHSVYRAIDSVYSHALNQLEIPKNKLIAVGQSVGSGPACFLAEKEDLAGLVLITPLKSVYRVPFHYPIFPRDRFPNIERVPQISEPLMIIHGDKDQIIPQSHGYALAEAYQGNAIFHDMKGRGHNDISGQNLQELKDYVQLFVEFANTL